MAGQILAYKTTRQCNFRSIADILELPRNSPCPVAPVGYVWLLAQGQNSLLNLWQEDGSQPTEEGTYLAACVFYGVIFQQSPKGLTYQAGLTKEPATFLQQIAGTTVLDNAALWNLH
jgi:hypothetical protein